MKAYSMQHQHIKTTEYGRPLNANVQLGWSHIGTHYEAGQMNVQFQMDHEH